VEVTNKEKKAKGKKQAQQGEVDEVVEREEEVQLHHAQQDKQQALAVERVKQKALHVTNLVLRDGASPPAANRRLLWGHGGFHQLKSR
jgi:hypothetical protein